MTATSFAALSTHGAVSPASPAARASARHGNASRSGARNSRMSPAARSRGPMAVSARSGYVSAYEIGTRMSG